MSSSVNVQKTTSGSIDMHIGDVFDAQRYLDLERQLFKVEPRPIPGRSVAQRPAKHRATNSFIRAATKFAYKLDDILRAPFEMFSSKKKHAKENNVHESDKEKVAQVQKRHDITPPPRVFKAQPVELQQPQCHEMSELMKAQEEASECEDVKPHDKITVVRTGQVKKLIKKYEDMSDLTSASSAKQASQTGALKVSFPNASKEDVGPCPLTPQRTGTRKAVTKPATIASPPTKMTRHTEAGKGRKHGIRDTSFEEAIVGYVEGTGNRRRNDVGTRSNAENMGTGRRGLWSKFRGLHRVDRRS